jgi:hypothetical protein
MVFSTFVRLSCHCSHACCCMTCISNFQIACLSPAKQMMFPSLADSCMKVQPSSRETAAHVLKEDISSQFSRSARTRTKCFLSRLPGILDFFPLIFLNLVFPLHLAMAISSFLLLFLLLLASHESSHRCLSICAGATEKGSHPGRQSCHITQNKLYKI